MAENQENFPMLAKTLYGMEDVLAKELRRLGAQDVETGPRMVTFKGDKGFMYKANLNCRTALRILKPFANFQIRNEEELYKQVKKIDWTEIIKEGETFVIDSTVNSEYYSHSLFMALKCKDGIVDFFREKTGDRPNVDRENPDKRINLHIFQRFVTLSMDSSGESLHKRGYRQATNIAPINEVLAAGILQLMDWSEIGTLLDPMCGSGTLLIEAAMLAHNIPANIFRPEFAFERWDDFDPELWNMIKEVSLDKEKHFHGEILGFDSATSAIEKAEENIEAALFNGVIDVQRQDFFKSDKPSEKGTIVFNPPYGERLPYKEDFYKNIGDTLKQSYAGYTAWMITSDLDALKLVGLRPRRKIKLYNGSLECRLVCYEMYDGSKKAKYQNQEEDDVVEEVIGEKPESEDLPTTGTQSEEEVKED
jgi:putative N6-adenine-specific DNA methylase